ncbi:MAG: EpsG family protein [Steroidobacteraceae bacterium]|nr:EpsG family protein [Steroidobacteraceae bacterium]
MPYLMLFGWAIVAAMLSGLTPALRRPIGAAMAATLVLFAGMRADSVDYDGYREMFEWMVKLDLDYPERLFFGKDVLFGVLMDVLQRAGGNLQALFLAAALLSVGLKQLAFARAFGGNTAVPWLVTLCLSFFLHDFTQIRTAIALALCFLALQHLVAGRVKPWLWLTLVAAGFHLSAILFLPVAGVLLFAPRRRGMAWVLMISGLVLALFGLFQLIAFIDPRLESHGDVTGVNWTALVMAVFKLALLTATALAMRHGTRRFETAARLVWPCVMFVATGVVLLFVLSDMASALAFRLYEFFDAFSIFVIAVGLMQRRAAPVLLALCLCTIGILLQYLPGLFTPYDIAPLASLFG